MTRITEWNMTRSLQEMLVVMQIGSGSVSMMTAAASSQPRQQRTFPGLGVPNVVLLPSGGLTRFEYRILARLNY
jgi:hypothetical protein